MQGIQLKITELASYHASLISPAKPGETSYKDLTAAILIHTMQSGYVETNSATFLATSRAACHSRKAGNPQCHATLYTAGMSRNHKHWQSIGDHDSLNASVYGYAMARLVAMWVG